ncbi:MAG TPA: hypothetical protein VJN93_13630 [Candidatus Acidoferrum sp.]|nr:hypothetical protein [Candidatus Acidoferrum sp.]
MKTAMEERSEKISRQLAVLATQRREFDGKLATERAARDRAVTRRAQFVEKLTEKGESFSAKAHLELDECDAAIRVADRMIESFEKSLAKIVNEVTIFTGEQAQVAEAIEQERRAESLRVAQIQYRERLNVLGRELDAVRCSMDSLNALQQEVVANCGAGADAFVIGLLAEFHTRQHNPEQNGIRPTVPNHGNFAYRVSPGVKR